MIVVVGERSPHTGGVVRRGRYDDPKAYWETRAQRGNFDESRVRKIRRLVPKGELTCMYLLTPHPIKNYWRSNEAIQAANAFVLGCPRPAHVLCAGMWVACAFRLHTGKVPKDLGVAVPGTGAAEGITFYRIPNLRDNNAQWGLPSLIRDCKRRLNDSLGA